MDTQKHSPLPWQDDKNGDIFCPAENYDLIATVYDPMDQSISLRDNAAFITRACNNHYKLIDALRGLLKAYEQADLPVSPPYCPTIDAERIANEALEEAEAA